MAERCGVGAELLEQAVTVVRSMTAARVLTHADADAARDFFVRRGFSPTEGNFLERRI